MDEAEEDRGRPEGPTGGDEAEDGGRAEDGGTRRDREPLSAALAPPLASSRGRRRGVSSTLTGVTSGCAGAGRLKSSAGEDSGGEADCAEAEAGLPAPALRAERLRGSEEGEAFERCEGVEAVDCS